MNNQTLEELYVAKFGNEFTWENMKGLIEEIINSKCDEQKKIVSQLYVEKTTLVSGEFVGDRRIVELLENAPTPK
jgi:hypothetical protein